MKDELVYDPVTDTYFKGNRKAIEEAIKELNAKLISQIQDEETSWKEFWEAIGKLNQ